MRRSSFWNPQKIPTDPWNIVQTLNYHLFMKDILLYLYLLGYLDVPLGGYPSWEVTGNPHV